MLFQKGREKEDKMDTVRKVKIRRNTVFLLGFRRVVALFIKFLIKIVGFAISVASLSSV